MPQQTTQTVSDIALTAIDSMAKSIAAMSLLRNELIKKDDEVKSRDIVISELRKKIFEMEGKLVCQDW
jgi:hypothetical protein